MAPGYTLVSTLGSFSPHHWMMAAAGALLLTLAYNVCVVIYNIWFHPLAKYPGPLLAAGTNLWIARGYFRGKMPQEMLELHNKYGPVVRTAPNMLSYVKPPMWKQIYGHRTQGQLEFAKDPKGKLGFKGEVNILTADTQQHAGLRKLFAHGFSEKAMREQESVLKQYVDVLCRKLEEEGKDGTQAVNISAWYNFVTFDFIGFLTFGESFDCLNTSTLHTWIQLFFHFARFLSHNLAIGYLPYLFRLPILLWAMPRNVIKGIQTMKRLEKEKIQHRIQFDPPVPDFMDKLISAYKAGKMSYGEIMGNARILIGAGSETTATALAGITYELLQNPRVLQKLTDEIRSKFSSPDEITFTAVNECKYLLACIEECLRVYPPAPQPRPRMVPKGGATVDGDFFPEGVLLGVNVYAASQSPENWTRPTEFIPERWTGEDPAFAADRREVMQPFGFGPRACIGRNLAYAEMKMILARVVWQFDLENATEGDWIGEQEVYIVWQRRPLWVKLRRAQR